MNQGRKALATAIGIAFVATGLAPAADAWAAGGGEVQDLKREVTQLRAQVQALQVAIAETTEMERQRDVNIVKALRDDSAPSQAAAPAPPPAAPAAASEPAGGARDTASPPAPAAARDDKSSRRASRHRHHRHSGRSRAKAAD